MQHNDLNIVIWNAKISAARSEFSAKNWRMCKRFILNIMKQDIDLIGVIEINEESVIFLKTIFKRLNIPYDVANGTQSRGNTRFDTCLIYNKSRLALIKTPHQHDCENTDTYVLGKRAKGGQKYDFLDLGNQQMLSLVLVHWPSMLTPEIHKIRPQVAQNLRFHLDQWLKINANIILAGDFNTEPYCPSITENLFSVREPLAPIRSKHGLEYFYNPSWNFLHVPPPSANPFNHTILGTYYLTKNRNQHWFTLDQVMFSKGLLNDNSGWKYSDNSLKILGVFDITDKVERWSDHLPIQFKLTWRT